MSDEMVVQKILLTIFTVVVVGLAVMTFVLIRV